MKILVTGAAGFLGASVCRALSEQFREATVIGVTRRGKRPGKSWNPACEWITCDLLEDGGGKKLPETVDVVVHLAGYPRNPSHLDGFSSQVGGNVVLTSRVADYAVKAKAECVLFASSSAIYSGVTTVPFVESVLALPTDHLGATKLAAEAILKARAVAGQFHALALRIFTAYGPGSRRDQFIPQAIEKLRSTDAMAKFGAWDVERDFIHVDDVARAFAVGLARREVGAPFEALNVGTGRSTSIRCVVESLARMLNVTKPIEFAPEDGSQVRSVYRADVSRIAALLDWKPTVELAAGLRTMVDGLTHPT